MKKTMLALVTLSAVSTPFAQSAAPSSSVTIFGVVDAMAQVNRGSVSSSTRMSTSGLAASRLGFRGQEDLGGGMLASFWLEAGLNNDSGVGYSNNTNNQSTGTVPVGGLTFTRRSTVSLSAPWGEIRMGRDYTPSFWNLPIFDPFYGLGSGATQSANSPLAMLGANGAAFIRASNSIGYLSPGCAAPYGCTGVYGQAMYFMGENASNATNSGDGTGTSGRIGYAQGPFNMAFAVTKVKFMSGNVTSSNLGGSYQVGAFTALAQYSADRLASPVAVNGKGFMAGGVFLEGQGEFKATWSQYKIDTTGSPKTGKLSLGYVYNLSKRTALYTTVALVRNSGGAANTGNFPAANATGPNQSASAYDFGIKHTF